MVHAKSYRTRVSCLTLGPASAVFLAFTAASAGAQSLAQRVQQLEQKVGTLTTQVNTLNAKVASLETMTQKGSFSVDCDAGQKIQDLPIDNNRTPRHLGPVSIEVSGVCVEGFTITRDDVILVGAPGAEIQTPPTGRGVAIRNSHRVFIGSITFTSPVSVDRGSEVNFDDVRIHDNPFHGLSITGSTVEVTNSFIENNGGAGIFAWNSAHVRVVNTQIADNAEAGLALQNGSSAQLQDGTRVTRNQDGVGLWLGSSLELHDDTTIDFNVGTGLRVNVGSTASAGIGVFIQDNTGDGVDIGDSSTFVPGPAVIQRNAGWGVNCRPAPEVPQLLVGGGGGPLNAPGNVLGTENCPVVTP